LGDALKIAKAYLDFNPLLNFHTYMTEILRSLREFNFGAKVITALYELPADVYLEFQ
jgi:hypothetical protein